MLAAGEGIIFREHVSVGRGRSTSGVNLKQYDCGRAHQTLLGNTASLDRSV